MVKMGVGKDQVVNCRRVKTEIPAVFLLHVTAALVHAAVDENLPAVALDQVTGTGHVLVRPMEFYLHVSSFG